MITSGSIERKMLPVLSRLARSMAGDTAGGGVASSSDEC
jgi:hypothetical protein